MKTYPKALLEQIGIPVCYGMFKKPESPPFFCFLGAGQENFDADNKHFYKKNNYQVEYYYKIKDEEMEDRIEELFSDNNILYEKSEDSYIEEDDMWVIFYDI